MNNIIKQNKIFVAGIAVALIGFGYYWMNRDSSVPTLTSSDSTPVTQELLTASNKLDALRLDTTVFDSAVYLSLNNFSVPIPAQPSGRRNPFAPLGANN